MSYLKVSCLAGIIGLSLSACTSFEKVDEYKKEINTRFNTAKIETASNPHPRVLTYDGMYVEKIAEENHKLPKWVYNKTKAYNNASLSYIADDIASEEGALVFPNEGVDMKTKVTVKRPGQTVLDVFRAIEAKTGYQVDFNDKHININKFVSKVFHVRQMAGEESNAIGRKMLQSNKQSGSNDVSSDLTASNGEEYSVLKTQYSLLEEYQAAIESLLGCKMPQDRIAEKAERREEQGAENKSLVSQQSTSAQEKICDKGATVTVLEGNNSVLVRSMPSQLKVVQSYVEQQTKIAHRQVRVKLKLVTLEVSKDWNFNLNMKFIDEQIGKSDFSLNYGTNNFDDLASAVLSPDRFLLGHTSGSALAVDILEQQGSLLDEVDLEAEAMNHTFTRLTKVEKQTYIADRPLSQFSGIGGSEQVRGILQKNVESGEILYVLPNIGESDVVLRVSGSLSSLKILEKGRGEEQVESPNIKDKSIGSIVKLKPGEVRVVGRWSSSSLKANSADGVSPGLNRSANDNKIETIALVEVELI